VPLVHCLSTRQVNLRRAMLSFGSLHDAICWLLNRKTTVASGSSLVETTDPPAVLTVAVHGASVMKKVKSCIQGRIPLHLTCRPMCQAVVSAQGIFLPSGEGSISTHRVGLAT
jgi:hypothetical protein